MILPAMQKSFRRRARFRASRLIVFYSSVSQHLVPSPETEAVHPRLSSSSDEGRGMPAPTTIRDFLHLVRKSGQIDESVLDGYLGALTDEAPVSPRKFAIQMI